MQANDDQCDVLVVGAGIGGICAATLLARAGYRVLLTERLDRVGGRASTEQIDGFLVNTGAAAFEFGGALEQVCRTVGVPYGAGSATGRGVRVPRPMVVLRLGRMNVDLTPVIGGWANGAFRWICRVSLDRLPRFAAERGLRPEDVTFAQWLHRFTKNRRIHAMLRNPLASFFVTEADELPAAAVFTFFSQNTGLRRFGFHPEGSIGVSHALLERFAELGGRIRTSTEVRRLRVADGRITGAVLATGGTETEIDCAAVISDAGPRATVELVGEQHFPQSYLREVENARPAALLAVNFAMRNSLGRFGAMTFGPTKNGRLLELINFTPTCPEMAPPGWHLYLGWGLPVTTADGFDGEREMQALLEDLRTTVPGFDSAHILSTTVNRDDWPGQHAAPGTDLSPATPIPNLWNVGDGVKNFGDGGTESVAKTSRAAVDAIGHTIPPHTPHDYRPART
ncbi:NAD(P)/FAD-dependent oxidoreductase [Nocardia sp. BMG51109]|uniref:phytoene desaturase family protein n=1 Tax=Nocardia sp. BMG51109 TaxID=1056816 RepID=UPI0004676974|nr:FAD-dependent oxidoreductase [Nocardia sp. BMG51109]